MHRVAVFCEGFRRVLATTRIPLPSTVPGAASRTVIWCHGSSSSGPALFLVLVQLPGFVFGAGPSLPYRILVPGAASWTVIWYWEQLSRASLFLGARSFLGSYLVPGLAYRTPFRCQAQLPGPSFCAGSSSPGPAPFLVPGPASQARTWCQPRLTVPRFGARRSFPDHDLVLGAAFQGQPFSWCWVQLPGFVFGAGPSLPYPFLVPGPASRRFFGAGHSTDARLTAVP